MNNDLKFDAPVYIKSPLIFVKFLTWFFLIAEVLDLKLTD